MSMLASIRRVLGLERKACRFVEFHLEERLDRLRPQIEQRCGVNILARFDGLRFSTRPMVRAEAVEHAARVDRKSYHIVIYKDLLLFYNQVSELFASRIVVGSKVHDSASRETAKAQTASLDEGALRIRVTDLVLAFLTGTISNLPDRRILSLSVEQKKLASGLWDVATDFTLAHELAHVGLFVQGDEDVRQETLAESVRRDFGIDDMDVCRAWAQETLADHIASQVILGSYPDGGLRYLALAGIEMALHVMPGMKRLAEEALPIFLASGIRPDLSALDPDETLHPPAEVRLRLILNSLGFGPTDKSMGRAFQLQLKNLWKLDPTQASIWAMEHLGRIKVNSIQR
jgi:hypothetical protein